MAVAPRRRAITSVVLTAAWIGTAVAVGWVGFSYLLPQDLSAAGRVYGVAAAAAFYGRVFTFHAGLALAAAAAVGLVARRWRLAAVAGGAAAACLLPTGYACRPRTPPAAAGPTLRVMSVNLMYDRPDAAGLADAIRGVDPDLVLMEEYQDRLHAALRPALSAAYPYQCLEPRLKADGLAVYSKRPFVDPPRPDVAGERAQIRVVVRLGGRPVAVYVVHPHAPLGVRSIHAGRLQTVDLARQLVADRLPAVAAGDWNFTAETPNAAALARAGLTDAFDLAGGGRASTWPVLPRWRAWLPGVRIDHVYLTPGLTCTRYATGPFDGSDHLPIVADVSVAAR